MTSDKKLKILLVPSDYWSGIGAMARHLANSVKGVDYYLFTTAEINRHQEEFIRLVSSVDIVHWLANLSWTKLPANMDLREFPVPNIAAIHHIDENLSGFGEKEEAAKLPTASTCDVIQVESEEWLGYVQSRTKTPVFLAHQAINPQQFIPNRKRRRPGKPFQIGTFGFARELKDRKRIDILLGSLSILNGKNYPFELVVQGPHWNILQEPFAQKGIKVKNLGYLSPNQALKSYRLLDLYVCSSDVEGGPLPVLEALASGVPVVSTRVGVAMEALAMGGGILVDKGDSKQLASAIASIMDNSTLYQQLANEAVQVSEKFSWGKIGKEYLAMYRSALEIKRPTQSKFYNLGSPKIQRTLQFLRNYQSQNSFIKKLLSFKPLIGK
jgi:glycosyltransferase involved in cell wall biosynthesis